MMRSIRPGVVVVLAATVLAAGTVATMATSATAADDPFPDIDVQDVPQIDAPPRQLPPQLAPAGQPPLQAEQQVQPAQVLEDCYSASGEEVVVERFAGANRFETAVCTSQGIWPAHDDPEATYTAQAVVLARGDKFPDALAGGPLAAYLEGPLLLTTPTQLPPVVMAEIQRVLAPGLTVYLLGGGSSVSNGIKSQLEAAGYATKRLAGSNRYETAIAIAEELPDTSNFFFVTGRNFPDALAAGTAAGALSVGAKFDEDPETRPFALLLTNDDEMPDSTFNFAVDRGSQFGVWTLVTTGGMADRAAVAAFGTGNLGLRFVGSNRYQTATDIAEYLFTDTSGVFFGTGVGLSTGLKFPDALGATANLALWNQPLLLTHPDTLSSDTRAFLRDHAGEGGYEGVTYLTAFGGTTTISSQVLSNAAAAYTPAA